MEMIKFSKETSNDWRDIVDYNFCYLQSTENYLNDLINSQGYIYEENIYKALGIQWDPSRENRLYLVNNKGKYRRCLELEVFPQKGGNEYLVYPHIQKES